jgi:hypothetical protein
MGEQLGVEVRLELGDQRGALFVPELLQQIRLVRGMQCARELRGAFDFAGLERLLDGADELLGRGGRAFRLRGRTRRGRDLGHGRVILEQLVHRPRRAPTG